MSWKKKKEILISKADEIKRIRKETDAARQEELKRLEKIAGLSKEEAKKILLQLAEEQNRDILAAGSKNWKKTGKMSLKKRLATS